MKKLTNKLPNLRLLGLVLCGLVLNACDNNNYPTDNIQPITNGGTRSQDINTNRTDSVFLNIGPVFVSLPSVIQVPENQLFIYQIEVTHPMNKAISFSLSGVDADQIDLSSSGTISFKHEKNYEDISNHKFEASVTISDGTIIESRNFIVMVTDVLENTFGEASFNNAILQ